MHPDFPKPGILFRDIFPVLRNATVFGHLIDLMCEEVQKVTPKVEVIVGLESRGFLFAPMMAARLGVAFVPIRKAGKLPGKCKSVTYTLEYGSDKFEIQEGAVKPGQSVAIVDDLLATGGTMKASVELIESLEAKIAQCLVVIELKDLKGSERFTAPFKSLIQY